MRYSIPKSCNSEAKFKLTAFQILRTEIVLHFSIFQFDYTLYTENEGSRFQTKPNLKKTPTCYGSNH